MSSFTYQSLQCYLRPIKLEDLDKSVMWRNNSRINENIQGYRYPITLEMERRWLEGLLNNEDKTRVAFSVVRKKDNELAGFVFLNNIDFLNRNAKLGTVLGEEMQGMGLGKECSNLICEYGFKMLNLIRIYGHALERNEISIKMCESIGFEVEGIMKNHFYSNGKYHNVVILGRINE